MNLAFQALALFLLALPGILFGRSSHVAPRYRERVPIADEMLRSIISAVCLHAAWLWVTEKLSTVTGVTSDLSSVLVIVSGLGDDESSAVAIKSVSKYANWILLYFASICLTAVRLGTAARSLLRSYRHRWIGKALVAMLGEDPNVRRNKEWRKDHHGAVAGRTVTAGLIELIVIHGGKPFRYRPVKVVARYSDDGLPCRLLLIEAKFRPLEDDSKPEMVKSKVSLRYSDVASISVAHFDLGLKTDSVMLVANSGTGQPKDIASKAADLADSQQSGDGG